MIIVVLKNRDNIVLPVYRPSLFVCHSFILSSGMFTSSPNSSINKIATWLYRDLTIFLLKHWRSQVMASLQWWPYSLAAICSLTSQAEAYPQLTYTCVWLLGRQLKVTISWEHGGLQIETPHGNCRVLLHNCIWHGGRHTRHKNFGLSSDVDDYLVCAYVTYSHIRK